jgi:hypothetical protein
MSPQNAENRPDIRETPASRRAIEQLRREVAEVNEREQKRLADESAYRAKSPWRK